MGLFGNLKSDGLEETQDRLGGYTPLETDAYNGKIKAAYAGKSSGGAQSVTVLVDLENGREYRETLYVTNKKGENFFLNKNDKTKKVPLPGFTVIDDLCLVTTEKPLAEQDTEDKVLNIYDPDQKKEVPTSVPVLTGLTGQDVTLGIVKQLVNKNEKQGDQYVPTAETREENVIDKIFHNPSKMTVVEARQGATEPKFYDAWVERNKGNTRDKREIKDGAGGVSGRPSRGPASAPTSGADGAPRTSLFGGKS